MLEIEWTIYLTNLKSVLWMQNASGGCDIVRPRRPNILQKNYPPWQTLMGAVKRRRIIYGNKM